MAELERKYIIPLRKEYMKVPIWKRTKKAVTATREFLQKHMKTEDVRLGKYLNQELWARSIKRPPHKIEVIAKKIQEKDKTYVTAELTSAPKEEPKKKEEKKQGVAAKLKEAIKEAPEDKEREAEIKKETQEKKKILEKETNEKEERAHKPETKERGGLRKDHKKELFSETGKTKQHQEKTGRF